MLDGMVGVSYAPSMTTERLLNLTPVYTHTHQGDMTMTTTTVKWEGEDLDPSTIYDASGFPKGLVTKAWPEGTTVMYRTESRYGAPKEGVLKSHTPHIVERSGGYGSERTTTIRPARKTRSGYRSWDKAETWANRSVGFLITDAATGEDVVAKYVCGTPSAHRIATRRRAIARREQVKRTALYNLERAVRRGVLEAAIRNLVTDLDPDDDVVETDRYGTPLIGADVVEALIEALAPGDLAHHRANLLDAIEAGTLPEEVEE